MRRASRPTHSALRASNGFGADCCRAAPSVLEFDADGKLLRAWGGPADPGFLGSKCKAEDGCVWPNSEHGIYVDEKDNVWIAGNAAAPKPDAKTIPWTTNKAGGDGFVLKFDMDGNFKMRIGGTPHRPRQQQQRRRHERHAAALSAGRHGGRSQDQPSLRRRRLWQSPHPDRRCRHRQIYRSFRRLWKQPDRRRGGRGCRRMAAGFRQGRKEAGLLPQPGALREDRRRRQDLCLRSRQ